MSLPAANNLVFWGVNTILRISGATFVAVSNVDLKYGHETFREVATGTSTPYIGNGAFNGTIKVDGYGHSDNRWDDLVALSSGRLLDYMVQWVEQDTQGNAASGRYTWTISGVKFYPFNVTAERDGVVRIAAEGIYGLVPSRSGPG